MGEQLDSNLNNITTSVGQHMTKDLRVHLNLSQESVFVTTDKLQLILQENQKQLQSRASWQAPLGLFISTLLTLCTADFKESFSLTKEVWQAVFLLVTFISFIWLVSTIVQIARNWKAGGIPEVIKQIKSHQEAAESNLP